MQCCPVWPAVLTILTAHRGSLGGGCLGMRWSAIQDTQHQLCKVNALYWCMIMTLVSRKLYEQQLEASPRRCHGLYVHLFPIFLVGVACRVFFQMTLQGPPKSDLGV